jgi:Thrombospondin type 3 repeat
MGARRKASFVTLAVTAAVVLTATAALADGIKGDADNDALSSPTANTIVRNQQVGTTVSYAFSVLVFDIAPTSNNVFANDGDTVSVGITRSGPWLASPAGSPPAAITLSNYLENGTGTIAVSVPRDACGVTQTMTVSLQATASNGRGLTPDTESMTYTITGVGTCGSSDVDRDGVPDDQDNCPNVANADQADADRDGVGDLCDSNAFPPRVGDQRPRTPRPAPRGPSSACPAPSRIATARSTS